MHFRVIFGRSAEKDFEKLLEVEFNYMISRIADEKAKGNVGGCMDALIVGLKAVLHKVLGFNFEADFLMHKSPPNPQKCFIYTIVLLINS